jgi:SNF family Na+-dependent transporter
VTAVQLVFFTFFHEYIAWYTREPDGGIARISVLTDDYFTWLPIPTIASIIVIVASIAMIVYDNYRFERATQIMFSIIGITVAGSLVAIFPFDFSVIPNATAVDVVPTAVRAFFILLAVFYGVTALIMFVRLRRRTARQEP